MGAAVEVCAPHSRFAVPLPPTHASLRSIFSHLSLRF